MNVQTITMPRAQAARKLRACQQSLAQKANAEYEAAAAGYAALAAGKALLDLNEVFRECAYDPKGRPRLAVARADRTRVAFRIQDGSNFTAAMFDASSGTLPRTYRGALVVRVPYVNEWASEAARKLHRWQRDGHAIVPMVPPAVLPASALRERHILWEVKAWADAPIRSTPDRDPYLLRHLAGSLYIVEAAWDLTDLERAIINGRAEKP
jgi:hypothetical protein